LERNDWHPRAGERGGAGEGRNVVHAFDVEADRRCSRARQRFEHVRHIDIGEIADGEDGGDGSARRVMRVQAMLPDWLNGDAAIGQHPVLVGPKGGARCR
jgi:hypothetical protein